jgi:hypothetical protein
VASLAVLGAPDIVLLTLTEFAGQAYRINRAAHLPLLVDADHGYGNALNVKRTVEELETAGVAGLMKAILALHHKVLPPTIKVTRPLEALTPGESPFYVNAERRPWLLSTSFIRNISHPTPRAARPISNMADAP